MVGQDLSFSAWWKPGWFADSYLYSVLTLHCRTVLRILHDFMHLGVLCEVELSVAQVSDRFQRHITFHQIARRSATSINGVS
jgi:hypothetical protein